MPSNAVSDRLSAVSLQALCHFWSLAQCWNQNSNAAGRMAFSVCGIEVAHVVCWQYLIVLTILIFYFIVLPIQISLFIETCQKLAKMVQYL